MQGSMAPVSPKIKSICNRMEKLIRSSHAVFGSICFDCCKCWGGKNNETISMCKQSKKYTKH